MRKLFSLTILSCLLCFVAHSQGVAINSDGSAPDTSAMLDVKSSNKGVLIPRLALTGIHDSATIHFPKTSLLVYNTATAGGLNPGFYYWNVDTWTTFGGFNYVLQQNLNTNGKYISGDGGNNGLFLDSTIVLGNGTAQGLGAVSIGESYARGKGSIAIGSTGTLGDYATAIGKDGEAQGIGSTAIGFMSSTGGDYSTAIGTWVTTWSPLSFVAGDSILVRKTNSIAVGNYITTNGSHNIALGNNINSTGDSGVAVGSTVNANGPGSFAVGNRINSTASQSFGIGNSLFCSGAKSFALGNNLVTNGASSVALGSYATTSHQGSFILADNSTTNITTSSSTNQMTMRFDNGYRLFSNSATTVGVMLAGGGNAWSTISDVFKKENFEPVDGEAFLQKISAMPLTSWNYKGQQPGNNRHYGPMAQDFYAAFGKDKYGTIGNDTTINQADFDGINFIGIQALEKRTDDLKNSNTQLKNENTQLKEAIEQLRSDLKKEQGSNEGRDQEMKKLKDQLENLTKLVSMLSAKP